jgi:hypothetical protein
MVVVVCCIASILQRSSAVSTACTFFVPNAILVYDNEKVERQHAADVMHCAYNASFAAGPRIHRVQRAC